MTFHWEQKLTDKFLTIGSDRVMAAIKYFSLWFWVDAYIYERYNANLNLHFT